MTEHVPSLASPLRTAITSGSFRYQLTRQWKQTNDPSITTIIMLNPSTADAHADDRTIRRCMSLANAAGVDGLRVVNLFAYRSTDPARLKAAPDAVGSLNDKYILDAARTSTGIIAAWGAHSFARARARQVYEMLLGERAILQCWGTTKDGSPRHPLYVHGSTPLVPWSPADVHALTERTVGD